MFKDRLPTLVRFSKPQTARIDEEPVKRVRFMRDTGRCELRTVYKEIIVTEHRMSVTPGALGDRMYTIRVGDLVVTVTFPYRPTDVQKWRICCFLYELYLDRTTRAAPWLVKTLQSFGAERVDISASSFGDILRDGMEDMARDYARGMRMLYG